MHIALENPNQREVIQLIEDLDAYQKPLYPAESHHGIDMDALSRPNVLFAVIRDDDGSAIGCGGIVLEPESGEPINGELKRMFIRPEHRGRGLSKRLLAFLEEQAGAKGCKVFTLETGIYQPEALALYERSGYKRCAPFGNYQPDPMSVFMIKKV
jgi:putative acetyltransferase